ncbi:conjugative transposon TraM protein [Pedobacter sp. CG_S7]|uniref:conjugative transposon protein TraM n=1 Tax=Pedobacter sp. CG_S7 TaxID=3143930 RepID=UPI0033974DFE
MATSTPKTTQFLRKRKMLTLMPFIVFPFITLIFWSMDGGTATAQDEVVRNKGINTDLPSANLKTNVPTDKMSIYAQSNAQRRGDDPITTPRDSSIEQIGLAAGAEYGQTAVVSPGLNSSPTYEKGYKDPNEAKVNAQLNQLYQTLEQNDQAAPYASSNPYAGAETNQAAAEANRNVDQLSNMIAQMQSETGEPDPEMRQMDGMLEKILDIQNPGRVRERLREKSIQNRGAVYAVNTPKNDGKVSIIRQNKRYTDDENDQQDTIKKPSYKNMQAPESMTKGRKTFAVTAPANTKRNGFYGLANRNETSAEPNAVQAVIHQNQTLVVGSTVKMRLITDIYLNGQRIPKDNFVYGVATIQGERLNIAVNSVRYGNSLYPVSLMVYDMDGLNGIYIPGAIERDASKDALSSGINGVEYMSIDPSITTQMATTAVSGAKGLLTKKVKLIKVNVKANYKVLLQDSQQQNL